MKTFVYLTVFLFLISCNTKDDDNNNQCIDIACTEQFVTLTVSIKDAADNPVALDAIMVTITEKGSDITRTISDSEWGLMRQNGVYPLFGDEHVNDYQNMELELNFKGFISITEVVNANFIVGADCCHVILVSGDPNLLVN